MHVKQIVEEFVYLGQIQLLVNIDIVLCLDQNCMVLRLHHHFLVQGSSSVDHYFQLKPSWVVLMNVQILKEPEHKPRHKVKSQNLFKLFAHFQIRLIDQNRSNPQF